MIVLDTSVIIFWTTDRTKLSQAAVNAINDADPIVISSMSIWEIAWKVKLGKLIMPISSEELVKRLEKTERVQILPVDVEMWLKNTELEWDHRDPADRTIVATAMLLDADLVASDREMRKFYEKAVW